MRGSQRPERVPLTGADCFLRAFDAEVRRTAGASHLSQLVLRLGPGLDVELLRKVLAEVAEAQPIVRAPVRRRFGVGLPEYRLDLAAHSALPEVAVSDAPSARGAELPPLFAERLSSVLDGRRGELLRVDVVRYGGPGGPCDLALTWLHYLLDGSGSERFVQYLDEVGRGVRRASDLPNESLPPAEALELRARGEQARSWRARLKSFADRPPQSLAGPLRRTRQSLVCDLETFSPEDTARVVERAKRLAGFLTPMLFYLAASLRAHLAVFRARGAEPASLVVPLPVNLRAKGAAGELFGTRVSLVWFQVTPEACRDFAGLLAELKAQRLSAIKAGMVEAGEAALDFARFAPRRVYARMARSAFAGELCSFFFAYTDEFLAGLDSFLGAPIENGCHSPSVPPSPGSGAIFSLRRGRLNFSHVHQAGVFRAGELARFRAQLRADLLGIES
jgi:hypothetical protein